MARRRLGAQVEKIHKLEEEVVRLNDVIAGFGPKKFEKTSCPYYGNCAVTDCTKLIAKCKNGEERNCLECADFNNDDKCDNWGWRNCVITRVAEKMGKGWVKLHKQLSQINIRQVREQVKVV